MIIFNRYKVTDIKKFKRFIFLSILLISFITFSFIPVKVYSNVIPQYDYISVKSGDTLWSIASSHGGAEEIRELIYEISKLNNIHDALIHPGDIIKIPKHLD